LISVIIVDSSLLDIRTDRRMDGEKAMCNAVSCREGRLTN